MKYNNRYRKCVTKSVDSQAFSQQYLDGRTATEWVLYARALNDARIRGELGKHAHKIRKTFLQAHPIEIVKTPPPTANSQ